MKHVFIINPTAGKSDSRQKNSMIWRRSCGRSTGWRCQCLLTK